MRNETPEQSQEKREFGNQDDRGNSSGEGSENRSQQRDLTNDRDGKRPRIYKKSTDTRTGSDSGSRNFRTGRSEDGNRSRPYQSDRSESRPRWNENRDQPKTNPDEVPKWDNDPGNKPGWTESRDFKPRRSNYGDNRPSWSNDRDKSRSGDSENRRPRWNSGESSERSGNTQDRSADRPRFNREGSTDRPRFNRSESGERSNFNREGSSDRPRFNRPESGDRPRFNREGSSDRPRFNRPESGDKPRFNREGSSDRPRFNRPESGDKPRFNREGSSDRPRFDRNESGDRPRFNREGSSDRPRFDRNESGDRPRFNREGSSDRPRFDRNESGDRPRFNREGSSDRPRFNREDSGNRGFRKEGFNRSSGGNSRFPRKSQEEFSNWTAPTEVPEYKSEEPTECRLNKYLANAGLCSRREADEYIKTGVVKVNDAIITEMGYRVKVGDEVKFNDERIRAERKIYLILNKPKDYITTTDDPHAKKNVMELVENACKERIYPVGRLDRSTTGVLLFTNDGDLAGKLTHPAHKKKKIYHVHLDKPLTKNHMQEIADGITLDDGPIQVDAISYAHDSDKKQIGVEIHSGRNRIVRRIFETLGYRINSLDRVYFAGMTKKNLPRGRWRFLTEQEVGFLKMNVFK